MSLPRVSQETIEAYIRWVESDPTGQKAVQNFLDQKAVYAGSSVHFLTGEFDFGPVLARGFVKIKKGDTVESLYARLKEVEHEIYIKSLQKLCPFK